MANALRQNVWIIDTTGAVTLPGTIRSIKLCSGVDASTAVIRADDSNGAICYQAKAGSAADNLDPHVYLQLRKGFHITLSGTTPKVYLYME